MTQETNPSRQTRRTFVKRSVFVSVVASQPAFLAGLVRAEGKGSDTSHTTFHPDTTLPFPITTAPVGTTV